MTRQWGKRLETRSRRDARSSPDRFFFSVPLPLSFSLSPSFVRSYSMNIRVYIRRLNKTVRSNQHNDRVSSRFPRCFVEASELAREFHSQRDPRPSCLSLSTSRVSGVHCLSTRSTLPCLSYFTRLRFALSIFHVENERELTLGNA